MYISGYVKESLVDGVGLRTTVFISGCKHACPGCHNPESWDFKHGKEFNIDEQIKIAELAKEDPLVTGLTLSGGDPVYSFNEVIEFVKLYKNINPTHDVWMYTGFTFEELLDMVDVKLLEEYIDVVVDGLYIQACRDIVNCKFRGSTNQRIINVKESLKTGNIVVILG